MANALLRVLIPLLTAVALTACNPYLGEIKKLNHEHAAGRIGGQAYSERLGELQTQATQWTVQRESRARFAQQYQPPQQPQVIYVQQQPTTNPSTYVPTKIDMGPTYYPHAPSYESTVRWR